MVTLMTWRSSGGEKRSCNATCHTAKLPKCVCICGGRYHGKAHQPGGVEKAVRDTWEEAINEAEHKAQAEGMELDTSRLRKFIELEPSNHANSANGANHANHEIAVQGRLPLEVVIG
ncbi:hypothetical protein ES703_110123 [subsurface metagenome]